MARRHGRQNVVYIDGYDLSADSSGLDVNMEYDTSEVSGFVNRKYYIPGQGNSKIVHRAWFNRTAVTGDHVVLSGKVGSEAHVAVAFGTEVGDGGFAGSASVVETYQETSPVGGAIAVNADYQQSKKYDYIEILHPKGNLASEGNGKNDNAQTTNGLRAYAHVFAVLGGTPAISVEHSTALASGYVPLGTMSFSAIGAGAFEVSGAIEQYVRVNVANGSALAFVGYSRI